MFYNSADVVCDKFAAAGRFIIDVNKLMFKALKQTPNKKDNTPYTVYKKFQNNRPSVEISYFTNCEQSN